MYVHGFRVCQSLLVLTKPLNSQLKTRSEERYEPLVSREHEYYTYVREGWNSKVLAFRNKALEFFQTK
jgi:hypothetical protein